MRVAVLAVVSFCLFNLAAAEAPAPPKPLEKAEIEKLIQQLGSDDFNTRQNAEKALFEQGEAARGPLEAALTASKDAELQARAKNILKKINMPRDLASLTAEQRELATMKVKGFGMRGGGAAGMRVVVGGAAANGAVIRINGAGAGAAAGADESDEEQPADNPDQFMCTVIGKGENTIVDMGCSRLIIEGQAYNGMSSTSTQLRGAGSSSGQAGDFGSSYANNVAKFNLRGVEWSIHDASILKVGDVEAKLGTPQARRVIFVDSKGKVLHNVEVPVEKKKQDETKKEDSKK